MVDFYLCSAAPEGAFQPVEGDHCPYCGAPIIDHEKETVNTYKFEGGIINPKSPPVVDGTMVIRDV